MSKGSKAVNFKEILLLLVVIGFSLIGNKVLASDNVLQAIQVDGVKDSYNIVLKSDDVADLKKTVQAPNKMVLTLKGIRASKTINTIYNNTSSVDSVVVEPINDDTVKILIQAENVGNAGIHFDTLKTPLGVLDKTQKQSETSDEIVLNNPMNSYKPVYDESDDSDDSGFSIAAISGPAAKQIKNILKNEKISWMIAFGLFSIILLSGIKIIKGKDSEIKVGLTQSLKEREINLYKNMGVHSALSEAALHSHPNNVANNYGIRAYQNDTRSPYVTSEIQRQRLTQPMSAPVNPQPVQQNLSLNNRVGLQSSIAQNIQTQAPPVQSSALKTAPVQTMSKPKTTNIDSIKFLESMTKIYEKNGRSDLAQGLKANMKKAKGSLV